MQTIVRSALALACIAGMTYNHLSMANGVAPARPKSLPSGSAPARPKSPLPGLGTKKNPGFDLINKTGSSVAIRVINGDSAPIRYTLVKPALTLLGKTLSANNQSALIDINQPTLLVVWNKAISEPDKNIYTVGAALKGEGTARYFNRWIITPTPTYVYHFKPGKSIYVTLDKGGELRPQTGPSSGSTGKTDAGYPLANEVKQDDIIKYTGKTGAQGELE